MAAPEDAERGRLRSKRVAVALCTSLLLAFAFLAWSSVSTKSATYDEVLHAPAGYVHLRHADFRVNAEHPPLWKAWAALPWLGRPVDANLDTPEFSQIFNGTRHQWD